MAQDSSKADFWDTRYRDHVIPWDAGKVPPRFAEYARTLPKGARVLIPGCGSAWEAAFLAQNAFDVLAIDFSEAAIAAARQNLGERAPVLQCADFFDFDPGPSFDVVYERAFLCALPARVWPQYARRMAQLIRPGGELAGYFFLSPTDRGPPFGMSPENLHNLLDPKFELIEDYVVPDSLPVFRGGEHGQRWLRKPSA